MNAAHLHLLVNHFPIILIITGTIILVTGLIVKSEVVKRTAYLVIVFASLFALISLLSGRQAEEVVENLPEISETYIETHEEAASVFALLSFALGGLSLIGFWASYAKKSFSNLIAVIVVVFALVTLFFGTKTGNTGGEIRHSEIRK